MTPHMQDPQAYNLVDIDTVIQGNTEFALALYQTLCTGKGNLCFSPYSISTALAMTYVGARGETERQMAQVLHFLVAQEQLHTTFQALAAVVNNISAKGEIELNIAHALWPHIGYPFLHEFLAKTAQHYGVQLSAVDYTDPDTARDTINAWVTAQTAGKIQKLIPDNALNSLTRLVLVNAIYFKGHWAHQFDRRHTRDAPFWLEASRSIQTPLMSQEGRFLYSENEVMQMVILPYIGTEVAMAILLPRTRDGLIQLEQALTQENIERWLGNLGEARLSLAIPRFELTCPLQLDKTLQAMGMVDAFGDDSDFSGIDGTDMLHLDTILHKAFVAVNEEGAEAAAATAVEIKVRSLPHPPVIFRADHPFVFMIVENHTGNILFLGRMVDPS